VGRQSLGSFTESENVASVLAAQLAHKWRVADEVYR
jgi:hypothetical protein